MKKYCSALLLLLAGCCLLLHARKGVGAEWAPGPAPVAPKITNPKVGKIWCVDNLNTLECDPATDKDCNLDTGELEPDNPMRHQWEADPPTGKFPTGIMGRRVKYRCPEQGTYVAFIVYADDSPAPHKFDSESAQSDPVKIPVIEVEVVASQTDDVFLHGDKAKFVPKTTPEVEPRGWAWDIVEGKGRPRSSSEKIYEPVVWNRHEDYAQTDTFKCRVTAKGDDNNTCSDEEQVRVVYPRIRAIDFDSTKTIAGENRSIPNPEWTIDNTKNSVSVFTKGTKLNLKATFETIEALSQGTTLQELKADVGWWVLGNVDCLTKNAAIAGRSTDISMVSVDPLLDKVYHYMGNWGWRRIGYDWSYKIQGKSYSITPKAKDNIHVVYVTYDTPRDRAFYPATTRDEVAELALQYAVGKYADGEKEIPEIAGAIMSGMYGEGWGYNPFAAAIWDPLDLIRTAGPRSANVCSDFANLMTELVRATGIDAHSAAFTAWWDGSRSQWMYTVPEPDRRACLLFNRMRACDGQKKEWEFVFHQVTDVQGQYYDSLFNYAGDPEHNVRHYWPQDGLDYYHHQPLGDDYKPGYPEPPLWGHPEDHLWP